AERDRLAAAVITLSPADHQVWQLVFVEDRPLAEGAGLTGVPEGTGKSRAHRAPRPPPAALGGGLGRPRGITATSAVATLTSGGSGPASWPRSGGGIPAPSSGSPGGCCARRAWPAPC